MKKLLLFLALAAAGLQAWADVQQGGQYPEALFAVGNATTAGWDPGKTAILTKIAEKQYKGFVSFTTEVANGELKFLCQEGWGDMWGAVSSESAGISSAGNYTIAYHPNPDTYGSDIKFKPTISGLYLVTVDLTITQEHPAESVTLEAWSSSSYYEISSLTELKIFANCVNRVDTSIKGKLTADITGVGVAMDFAIGWYESDSNHKCYSAEFDGNFKTVNLAIDESGNPNKGLFGAITSGAYIHDVTVTGFVNGGNSVGGIVGSVRNFSGGEANIFNCKNEATITGSGANAAGILGVNIHNNGYCTTNIKYCCNTGNVTGNSHSALITGWIGKGSIKYTFASGVLSGADSNGRGEFVRYDSNASFYANVTMTGSSNTDGAMYYDSSSSTYNILNESEFLTIATLVNVGGQTSKNFNLKSDLNLAGESEPYMPIGTTTHPYIGTFNGENHKINLNVNNTTEDYQGLFGVVTDGVKIQNVVVTGSVTGHEYVGGIVGGTYGDDGVAANKTDIWNCGNEAAITGTKVGGIIGDNGGTQADIILLNCYNTGAINGTDGNTAALCGSIGGGNSNVRNCYNTGVVKIGGTTSDKFCINDNAYFTNCYCKTTDRTDMVNSTNGTITIVSDDAVTSGELCWKFVGNDGNPFTQDLSQAGHPTFGSEEVHAGKWFNSVNWDTFYNEDASGNKTVYQLNLDDSKTVYNVPANVTAKNVTLTRTFNTGRWYTFCSPVAIDKSNFSEIKELTGATQSGDNYTMTFSDAAGDIEPGKPYMVQVASTTDELEATGDIAVAAAGTSTSSEAFSGLTFNGVFASGNAPISVENGNSYFIISNNTFYEVDSEVALKAFRGYITVAGAGEVKALTFDFDDDPTAIEMVNGQSSMVNGQPIFNLAGQRISKMQKGINIVNGKKIIK